MPERHLDDDEEWEWQRFGDNTKNRRDELTEMIRKYQGKKPSTGQALIINQEELKKHQEDIRNMLARRGLFLDAEGNLHRIEKCE